MEKDWKKLDYHAIILEAVKKTRIVYDFNTGFFSPRFKSLNNLTTGNSKMIIKRLSIIADILYDLAIIIKIAIKKFIKGLFPKKDIIYGSKKDSSLVGTITFGSKKDFYKPIHNIYCEFWIRRWNGRWRKFGEAFTDQEGHFEIPFDLRAARRRGNRKLYLEIYQIKETYFTEEKQGRSLELFKQVPFLKKNLIGMRYSFGRIPLFFWQYRANTSIPRVAIRDHDKDAPQYYTQKRMDALVEQFIPVELTRIKQLAKIKNPRKKISIQEITDGYPMNLTRYLEKQYKGITRSDEYFGIRMMNGMYRGSFLKDKENGNHYWIKFFGIQGYQNNREYALPTAEIKFDLNSLGYPMPIEIHFTGKLNAYEKDPFKKTVYKKEDGADWEAAKRVARVSGAFCCEVDDHLSSTHHVSEQYAVAAYRNLRLSPIADLLFPHLKEVVLINHSADGFLVSEFIPEVTAITKQGALDRMKDLMGVQDWKNWTPMEAISDVHLCAKTDQLFWSVITDYVDYFFKQNEAEIKTYWYEVYCMSEDVVKHAVPVLYSDTDVTTLSEQEKEYNEKRKEYYDFKYCFDRKLERREFDGEIKTVSTITAKENYEAGMEEDWENLKQFCRHAIMTSTYLHSWINGLQYDELGEVLYNCGGLRYGIKREGIIAPEEELSIAPDLTGCANNMWFSSFLSRAKYGFIMNNEENDIHPQLIRLLKENEKAFEALNFDINNVESRTNI